mmetsp:Transcript_14757/g.20565  ORF Transcript_14757/g.20565 Transcript_14757/m.20565 type:complete len:86 (+) Transcript_14757:854-1111(+)
MLEGEEETQTLDKLEAAEEAGEETPTINPRRIEKRIHGLNTLPSQKQTVASTTTTQIVEEEEAEVFQTEGGQHEELGDDLNSSLL